jgi:dUTP pyrophosphatase
MNIVSFVVVDEKAVVPTKGTTCSVGYDLTAISVYKRLSERITLYDTGIQVCPPAGYYTEILPRSSLTKTGYILSNSVGVIDSDYRGNLLIALTKVDESMPDLEVPFTRCQLVLRRQEDFEMVRVDGLDDTIRGSGGFGSTDK